MTDAQYRVLGDLVAPGTYLLHEEMPGTLHPFWVVPNPTGLLDYHISPITFARIRHYLDSAERIETRVRYRITDAGRAAYAQAQARRAAQEAAG